MQIPAAILFDFDGTLADTGPDLVAALNSMRAERELPPITREEITASQIANGSRSMMRAHLLSDDEDVEQWRPQFLAAYDATAHTQTRLFDGIPKLLERLEELNVPWAIITNKPTAQTLDLLPVLGLDKRAAMVVCADTYPLPKPDPTGVNAICAELEIDPSAGLLVGDAPIDLQAAAAAQMPFAAAGWGYWEDETDWVLAHPDELTALYKGQ